jgi:hypothetical protein
MPLFRRRAPLHRRLAEEAGLSIEGDAGPARPGAAADPPGWHGEQRGEPGIHGVPRPRRWDAVVTADAPEVEGRERSFVVLGDGTPVDAVRGVDEELRPLAEALDGSLPPPFRAEAVARGGGRWAVAAARVRLVELPGVGGEALELVVRDGARTLRVDGRPIFGSVPAAEAVAAEQGGDVVLRARRVLEDVWEVETSSL